jgi:pyridinium-3,5-biscarboxylic acid mononucleotide synthase
MIMIARQYDVARFSLRVIRRTVLGRRMMSSSFRDILRQVQEGNLDVDQAEELITIRNQASPEETLQSFANLDHGRAIRTGFPEAVFAAGKAPKQVAAILDDMAKHVNLSLAQGHHGSIASTAILATR